MNDDKNIPKTFDPSGFETRWYQSWETAGAFEPSGDGSPYVICLPPPNVTGALHVGHALDHTLQDILIRHKRMKGFRALWIPGVDHAGIATQMVVERQLKTEGKSRHDLGREAFLERVWEWKKTYGDRIVQQIRRLGSSCAWKHERFTMDEAYSKAVRHVFVRLYNDGLIYRSKYIVSWSPLSQTALSDLEVIHKTIDGTLTYFSYKNSDGDQIDVATTRPETMLGDTAIAVHPDDTRYANLIGKLFDHPFVERKVPVISDPSVDPKFGTGAVKITPFHDPNDYQIGIKHDLTFIQVIDEDAKMTDEAGPFAGQDRFEARKAVVKALKEQNLLIKVEPHQHSVGHSERTGEPVEPMVSEQWFMKMDALGKDALDVVASGKTQFIPSNWTKTYDHWMTNIHDWCISRQLWWGHQIPVWQCQDCDHLNVELEVPTACAECSGTDLKQDDDVLDTWFSSALWPFATLGWPDNTESLKTYFPTNVLVTGFDIIFFWVSRMIMMSLRFKGETPFKDVLIHPLVKDEHGQKMSKSKGNVMDPLDISEKFGADALRFSLAVLCQPNSDLNLSEKRIEGYRNFLTKFWNAARFIEGLTSEVDLAGHSGGFLAQDTFDVWIASKWNTTLKKVEASIEGYVFSDAAQSLYDFVWNDYCAWYLELTKVRMHTADEATKVQLAANLKHLFEEILRALHPITPFITEELAHRLDLIADDDFLMTSNFAEQLPVDSSSENAVSEAETFIGVVTALRRIRAENRISPKEPFHVVLHQTQDSDTSLFKNEEMVSVLEALDKIGHLDFVQTSPSIDGPHAFASSGLIDIYVHLDGLVDVGSEINRLEKHSAKLSKDVSKLETKLSKASFVEKAPAHVVEENKVRLLEMKDELTKTELTLKRLQPNPS